MSTPESHTPEVVAEGGLALMTQCRLIGESATRHATRAQSEIEEKRRAVQESSGALATRFQAVAAGGALPAAYAEYVRDAGERLILALDALRKRGDMFYEHEAAGEPPVLVYEYDIVVDGKDLPRPCNYMLLRIKPPAGVTVYDWKRPYVIIDPRAGHGPGIGGFKQDSQVGVALAGGHPVYFVAFRPEPVPGQTLASVTHAEAAFLRDIHKRHPKAPRPVVIGNCQGGWATAILAATNPDLTGPIVLNGAPMSYWSGRLGQDPMRYNGGMLGGVLPALLMSDLGGGVFDGAHLVHNFEMLNPGRTWFRKYYDLFADVDKGEKSFLDFERWWGGFYLMNEAEIRWIVESLFVGNKLSKGEAQLETGRPIDLKAIRAPIIVFASHGDNITPPQQALNWIVDTYADETEIEIRGQRIVYMVHDQVGHLGIFVSSSVAKKEHTQMASTLKTIEALSPGLYEMRIEDMVGTGQDARFTVSFHKRRMADILALGPGRDEEVAFAAVARLSEQLAEVYDTTVRPLVRGLATRETVALGRSLHPIRVKRSVFSSRNPTMKLVAEAAERIRAERKPASPDNVFLAAEHLWADLVEQQWQFITDFRAFWYEQAFLATYAGPWGHWYGAPRQNQRARKSKEELRALPVVVDALGRIDAGGLPEAVVRMLVLLADSRGNVRRDRLERSATLLSSEPPFDSISPATRARMIHEQTLIAHFEPEAGLAALAHLLPDEPSRARAMSMVEHVVGNNEDMEPRTRELLTRMRETLALPALRLTSAAE